MLVNPNIKNEEQGFNPNVDNTAFEAQANGKDKFLWWTLFILSWLTIIGGIVLTVLWYKWGNQLRREQIEVNEAASGIDVNLTKRRETLIKLLEQTKAYIKFEKSTLEDVTKLRSFGPINNDINKANELQGIMDNVAKGINISVENYPDLKSSNVVLELMSASQYIETEIAASRRLYNLKVSSFNQSIASFPKSVKAKSLKCHSLPMFIASEIQKQDVDMSHILD